MTKDEREDEWIRAVQGGELEPFEDLIHLHATRLRAFIAMRLPVAHLIDEIAHETFVFAHRKIDDFEAGTDFGKWLRAIAFNLVRKETQRYKRSEKNQDRYLEHCAMSAAGSEAWHPESPSVAFLEECIRHLPPKQQELLQRRYKLVESTRDMAKALDKSEAWVRTTLCRVRTALRDCIERKIEADRRSNPSLYS